MKKIPSLFKRDYKGNRQVYNEVVEGCEWVLEGEGKATVKFDGTACMFRDGKMFKRFNRKHGKPAPEGWEPCEPEPDEHTGHWPGWVPIGDGPEDKWHHMIDECPDLPDGTYELVGPKIQGNPERVNKYYILPHGAQEILVPRIFGCIRDFLENEEIEGIVWHHPDGRMCKIKRRDFGLSWPIPKENK